MYTRETVHRYKDKTYVSDHVHLCVTMCIRKTVRRYKDKTYVNFLLVESFLTDKGLRQNLICSLVDLSPRPPE